MFSFEHLSILYFNIVICLAFRGIAKPSKKLKLNKQVEDPEVAEPEKQIIPEASEAVVDDPPQELHNVIVDPMGVDPSSTKPHSPIKPAEEPPS